MNNAVGDSLSAVVPCLQQRPVGVLCHHVSDAHGGRVHGDVSVGESQHCALHWIARVTCAEGTTGNRPDGPLCGPRLSRPAPSSVLHIHANMLPASFWGHGSRSVPRCTS